MTVNLTLTFKLDLVSVDMNQHAKYLGQRSFILDTYTQTGPYVTSKMQSKLTYMIYRQSSRVE